MEVHPAVCTEDISRCPDGLEVIHGCRAVATVCVLPRWAQVTVRRADESLRNVQEHVWVRPVAACVRVDLLVIERSCHSSP